MNRMLYGCADTSKCRSYKLGPFFATKLAANSAQTGQQIVYSVGVDFGVYCLQLSFVRLLDRPQTP